MPVYLDTVIVIYSIEGPAPFLQRARAKLADLRKAGYTFAVSDLTCLECLIKPYRQNDLTLRASFESFWSASDVVCFSLPTPVFDRAAVIRSQYNYALGDALHLAVAVENNCDRFLTNDLRLSRFTDLVVESLP